MDFISILSIFVLACFVGYFVVWSVTPALHTPLMAVTNAISSVIVVGALIAAAAIPPSSPAQPASAARHYEPPPPPDPSSGGIYGTQTLEQTRALNSEAPAALPPGEPQFPWAKWLGLLAVAMASVNIFGGFAVTARMLAMYKKKERKG